MADPAQKLSGKGKVTFAEVSSASAEAEIASSPTEQSPPDVDEEPNIFVAAQRGEIELLRQLIESGKASATDRDDQNITPLHWAAINAQLAACRYLIDQGAEVDAVGGDLVATPMQWAARNGYLYVIQLLISHNADPTLTDSQGYNTLHLVTHSSNVMSLLYLLQQPIAVDSQDAQGHTSLMWAAYQGDAISVDILLKHGASTVVRDAAGLTPLHWAVVRGNRICIQRIVEAGASLSEKDDAGKTPRDMAVELKSVGAFKKALEEAGFAEDGSRIPTLMNERNTKLAVFILPTIFLYLIFSTLSLLPWYTGIPLAGAEFFGMHHIITRVILNNKTYTDSVVQSPYFAAIISGSMFWVGEVWLTRLAPNTQGLPFSHLAFAISFLLCTYNFFRSVTLDPGTCPKPSSEGEMRSIIEDLASQGKLNGQTFCIECMSRKPLRSKHCRICKKCTARFDHHCPWVWNCVGVNNHRQFVVFVTALISGICWFDYITVSYFSEIVSPLPTHPDSICTDFPVLCNMTSSTDASFALAVACWASLQLLWTIVLLISQLWQIARQTTSFEISNLGRFGFMGGMGTSLATQQGHQHHSSPEGDDANLAGASPGHTHGHGGHRHGHRASGCLAFLLNVLGLDRFTRGKVADGLARASKASNPFDAGFLANCADFWTKGREIGVQYEVLYEVPPEGFSAAKRRKMAEARDEDDDESFGNWKKRRSLVGRYMPGFLSRGRGGSNPYQAVNLSEEV